MRSDMMHVIIDRPRTGGNGGKSKPRKGYKKALKNLEDLPTKEGISKRCGKDKSLNEHLSPLVRFLRKNCGRPWDKVYSEICENLSVRNATKAHVRDHAEQYVERNPIMVGKKAFAADGGYLFCRFFVHPKTGLLCHQPYERPWWRKREQKSDYIPGKDINHQYRLQEGVWYEFGLAPYPVGTDGKAWETVVDVFHNVSASKRECELFYGRAVYSACRRQLNKKEIKKLGLWDTELGREEISKR